MKGYIRKRLKKGHIWKGRGKGLNHICYGQNKD